MSKSAKNVRTLSDDEMGNVAGGFWNGVATAIALFEFADKLSGGELGKPIGKQVMDAAAAKLKK